MAISTASSAIKWYGKQVHENVMRAADQVNNAIALDVRTFAQESMRGPKSGRLYKIGNILRSGKKYSDLGLKVGGVTKGGALKYIVASRLYQASAPGEAPAIPHGTLRSSIIVDYVGQCHRRVGSNEPQARRLELGGKDKRGVYIAPRPYLRPALDKALAKVGGHIRDHKL